MDNITALQSPRQQLQTLAPLAAFRLRRAAVHVALRQLGADEYNLLLPETRRLSRLLGNDEILLSAVYGRYTREPAHFADRGLMAITNLRVLLAGKKPVPLQYNEIAFDTINSVQYSKAQAIETVTLNTRTGGITLRAFNRRCGQHFVQAVEDILCDRDRW